VPGTVDAAALDARLAGPDAIAVIKVGRHLAKIRDAVARSGRLDRAVYVERGTMADARIARLADKPDDAAPYFAVVLVPARERPS
jgi:precorrin-2/cobalt-factor-2 C20-methyltransferase